MFWATFPSHLLPLCLPIAFRTLVHTFPPGGQDHALCNCALPRRRGDGPLRTAIPREGAPSCRPLSQPIQKEIHQVLFSGQDCCVHDHGVCRSARHLRCASASVSPDIRVRRRGTGKDWVLSSIPLAVVVSIFDIDTPSGKSNRVLLQTCISKMFPMRKFRAQHGERCVRTYMRILIASDDDNLRGVCRVGHYNILCICITAALQPRRVRKAMCHASVWKLCRDNLGSLQDGEGLLLPAQTL